MKSEPEPRSPTCTSLCRGRCIGAVVLIRRRLAAPSTRRKRAADGAGDGAGDFADELLERGHGGGGEVGAGDGDIDVEVGDGVLQALRVLLDPFGRADQAFFLGVPTAEDDGALGAPALLEQRADAVNRLKHGGGAAVGIDCAVDPGVAMIAGDDPVVGDLEPWILPMTSQMVRRW